MFSHMCSFQLTPSTKFAFSTCIPLQTIPSHLNSYICPTYHPSSLSIYNPSTKFIFNTSITIISISTQTMTSHDQAGVDRAKQVFIKTFNKQPTIAVSAPGRVNLIGEHTDYNDGFVFPLALEKSTYIVACSLESGCECQVAAEAFPDEIAKFQPGDTPSNSNLVHWAKYIKGMTAIYERNNYPIASFQAVIVSDVPLGSGLSSSAALEMATAMMIEQVTNINVNAAQRAKMGQTCEQEFAGVPCGIMDQLISSCGKKDHALLIDCRSLETIAVPLDDPEALIVVANSCVQHQLSGSEYSDRRNQCEEAAKIINEKFSTQNITHLRDATMEMLDAVAKQLEANTLKRARHVISEDLRTKEAKVCLENGDLQKTGQLMYASHISLRDDFEVSIPQIDALVDIAMAVDGVYGSRITGGGFGGCTVTLVKKNALATLEQAFKDKYPAFNNGTPAQVFATRAGSGARVLSALL